MGPGGENPPVGPETQGSAGPGETGVVPESISSPNTGLEHVAPEPVELDHDLGPVTESSTTPEVQNLSPRQQAEDIIQKSLQRKIDATKQLLTDGKVDQAGYDTRVKEVENAINMQKNALGKLSDSVVEIVLPSDTLFTTSKDTILKEDLENFDVGYWGFRDGKKATVIMSTGRVTTNSDKKYKPASTNLIANSLAEGGRHEELSDGRWVITVPKE